MKKSVVVVVGRGAVLSPEVSIQVQQPGPYKAVVLPHSVLRGLGGSPGYIFILPAAVSTHL